MIESVFLPYQVEWILDRSAMKLAVKSRRIGITWATAYESCEVAAVDVSQGGSDFWYQTYAEDDAKEFIRDATHFARGMDQIISHKEFEVSGDEAREWCILPDGHHSIKITSITFSSGNRIVTLPHSPRKMRGKGGVYCLDEAAFHTDLAGALKATEAFEIWGGRSMIISTVTDDESEFTLLWRDIEAGRVDGTVHKVTLPEAYEQGLYKRVCQVRGKEWTAEQEKANLERLLAKRGAEQEFLCIPLRSAGQYMPASLVNTCMSDDLKVVQIEKDDNFLYESDTIQQEEMSDFLRDEVEPHVPESGLPAYLGVDFGRSSDLSVFSLGYRGDVLQVPVILEMSNIPFECQKFVFDWFMKNYRIAFAAIDATGNGSYLGEHAVRKYTDVRAEAIKVTEPWHAECWPKLKARFEDNTILIPRDPDIRRDLSMVQRINGTPKLPKKRIETQRLDAIRGIKRHGDAAVSLAMLTYAAGKSRLSYSGYEPTGKRGGHFGFTGIM